MSLRLLTKTTVLSLVLLSLLESSAVAQRGGRSGFGPGVYGPGFRGGSGISISIGGYGGGGFYGGYGGYRPGLSLSYSTAGYYQRWLPVRFLSTV
ncbi:MAG: hypothetical protein R3C28_16055 [Pirellulaceae bacterium]